MLYIYECAPLHVADSRRPPAACGLQAPGAMATLHYLQVSANSAQMHLSSWNASTGSEQVLQVLPGVLRQRSKAHLLKSGSDRPHGVLVPDFVSIALQHCA